MDIRKISYFTEVARVKSFSRAAQNLYISQPMLSKTIRQLEEELDVQLIDRSSKHFHLTDAGLLFYNRSMKLLSDFDELQHFMDDSGQLLQGTVSISVPSVVLMFAFPQLLAQFTAQYPEIRVELFEEGSLAVLESVLAGKVDMGIVMMPVNTQDIDVYPLFNDHAVLVTGPEHPLAKESCVNFSQLANEKFIIFNSRFTLNEMIKQSCYSAGFSPQISYQSSSDSFIYKMIAVNQGITILPRPIVLQAGYDVAYTDLNPPIPWKLALIIKKNKYIPTAALKMLQSTLQFFNDLEQPAED